MPLASHSVDPVPSGARSEEPHSARQESEITFVDIVNMFWGGRYLILGTVVLFLILGLVQMRLAAPAYTASMVVMPVASNGGNSGHSSAGREFSSLLDIGLPQSSQVAAFDMFRHALTSVRVASRLDQDHNLVKRVFRYRWNETDQTWEAPGGVVSAVKMALNWLVGLPTWTPPSAASLSSYLRDNIRQTKVDEDTPFLRLEFNSDDPAFASDLLRWVHEAADDVVRQDTHVRTQANIDYLRSQIQQTSVTELRSVLTGLILREESRMMLMSSALPYAAGVLEPATVSDAPTSPSPLKRLVILAAAGLFAGAALVVGIAAFSGLRQELRARPERRPAGN